MFDEFQTQTTNLRNLNVTGFLNGVLVPLAPLAEQKRIAATVEKVLARLNAARERLAKAPAILRRFRQAVLAAACSGRLTADWRHTRGINGTSDLDIPEGWTRDALRSAIQHLEQGWSPKCEIEPSESPATWGVIKTTAIQPLAFLENENKRLPDHLQPRPELEVHAGDLLITRAGPRLRAGVSCYVSTTRRHLIVCDKAYRFTVRLTDYDPEFVAVCLNDPNILEIIDDLKTGISDSGVNLTQERFLALELPKPPLEEQREILKRLTEMFRLANRIEKRFAAATARAEGIVQAVLAKAFRGELVPTEAELAEREGRGLESAEQLLERVRAARDAASSASASTARQSRPRRPRRSSAARTAAASEDLLSLPKRRHARGHG